MRENDDFNLPTPELYAVTAQLKDKKETVRSLLNITVSTAKQRKYQCSARTLSHIFERIFHRYYRCK